MTLDLDSVLLQNKCMSCYPFLGLLSEVMPHLQLLALVIPYSGTPRSDVTSVLALTCLT